MSRRTHIIQLDDEFGHDFPLNAQEVVVHVWIFDHLRQNDTRQETGDRVGWRSSGQVAGCLRSLSHSRIGWWASERWRGGCIESTVRIANGGCVQYIVTTTVQEIVRNIE